MSMKEQHNLVETRLRTAGLWLVDNFILLESLVDSDIWGVPGGGLEADETAEQGCLREYREEIGIEVQCCGLALINENFWRQNDTTIREYCFYFRVQPQDLNSQVLLPIKSREERLKFQWFSIDKLAELRIVPEFLKLILPSLGKDMIFLSTAER